MDDMEILQTKKKDDNFEIFTVRECRDADNGYCVYFEDPKEEKVKDPRPQFINKGEALVRVNPGEPGYDPQKKIKVEITYWLPKSYNVIPRPGYIKDRIEVPADRFRIYGVLGLANSGVYGIDILREDLDGKRLIPKTIALFYKPSLIEKSQPTQKDTPEETETASEKRTRLKKELAELGEENPSEPPKKSGRKKVNV